METAIQSILGDIEGAITYIIEGREDHPNRIDILKTFAPKHHAPRGGRGGGNRGNFSSGRQENQFQSQSTGFGGNFTQATPSSGFGGPQQSNGFIQGGLSDQIIGFNQPQQNDSMMMSPTIDQAPSGFGPPQTSNGFGGNSGFTQPANNGFNQLANNGFQQAGNNGIAGFPNPNPNDQPQAFGGSGMQQEQVQQGFGGGVGGFTAPVGTIQGEASMDDPPMAMFGLDEQQYQQAYEQAKQQGNFGEGLGMPFMSPKQGW
jgi:nucleoporin NUP42